MSFFHQRLLGAINLEAIQQALEDALGVSLLDIAVQIAATIILVIIVKKYFWGKITAFIEKRGELMQQEFTHAETARSEAETLKAQREAEYAALQANSKALIEAAKTSGEAERQTIVLSAKEEAKRLMDDASAEIASDLAKAKAQLSNEVVDLASMMAAQIIGKEVNPEAYDLDFTATNKKEN